MLIHENKLTFLKKLMICGADKTSIKAFIKINDKIDVKQGV